MLRPLLLSLAGVALLLSPALAQNRPDDPNRRGGKGGGGGGGGGRMPAPAFRTEVPAQTDNVILGRPADHSVTLSILAYEEMEGFVRHGPAPDQLTRETPRRTFRRGEPAEVLLDGLAPNSRHFYSVQLRSPGAPAFTARAVQSFTTARPPGTPFTFTLQADPHLDLGIDPAVYRKSLANVLAAQPDFHLDLGDTFMTDKYPTYTDATPNYLAQRYYFGLIGARVPVFLVLGNHDGESPGKGHDGEAMALWSNGMRKKYFPNPVPDAFYSGNATPHPQAGLLQNYFAWTWGDALFVALDQYWYTRQARGSADNWDRTLGRAQYDWLKALLERHPAKYTFILIHHLVGGETREGRGGSEASHFFEWGGRDLNGRDSFAQRRPGWGSPIHEQLARRGGAVVFHGHDHLYAHQSRDGVIYQLVPQPGHSRYDNTRSAGEYGYKSGVIQGASGILRVSVTPARSVVEYVRAYPDEAEGGNRRTGAVTHRFTVNPRSTVPATP